MACATLRPIFALTFLAVAASWWATSFAANLTQRQFPAGMQLVAVGGTNIREEEVIDDVDVISLSGNTHKSAAKLPSGLSGFGSTLTNNTIYVVGGDGPHGRTGSSFLAYDIAANNWTNLPEFPLNVSGNGVVAVNGSLLSLSGYADGYGIMDYPYRYDPNTQSWWKIPTLLPVSPQHHEFLCAVTDGSSIYYILASGDMHRSDDGAHTWKMLSSMSDTRLYSSCALVESGFIMVAGSGGYSAEYNSAEMYNIATDTWTKAPSMTRERASASAVAIPGSDTVVVCGGDSNEGRLTYTDCEQFSKAENKWVFTTFSLDKPRSAYGLFVTNNN